MIWQYSLVFIGAFLFDIVPFPFPPAFTIMVFLQLYFKLNIWMVVGIGVAGSLLGRYVLTLYIPYIAGDLFKPDKNEDVQYLGKVLKNKGWKSQLVIIAYSLLPLPTTPLFVAAGMAKIKPIYIIPAFFVGKFTSDALLVNLGKYGAENMDKLLHSAVSWESFTSFAVGLLMISTLLFIDWRTLIQKKTFKLNFHIWK
jgi:membrane protein YqaA with SNARE-associated domain